MSSTLVALGFVLVAAGAAAEIVGIDLGTTYSCVGVYRNGDVEIIPNELGYRVTPSVVAFTEEGTLVGEAARVQAPLRPEHTVYDAKRLIGRAYKDESVQGDKSLFPFKVVSSKGIAAIEVAIGGIKRTLEAAEVSAIVLGKMKQTAEAFLGAPVTQAVITVPAYFNDAQRRATKDAGAIAGLTVERVINEPTAAAIAYGLDRKAGVQTVLVFDLGGGTLDVSVLNIEDGTLEVMSTNGDTHLGGEDFDTMLLRHILKVVKAKHKVDLSSKKAAVSKLRHEAERAKRVLSHAHSARIEVDSITEGLDISETITRARFEELCLDLFKRIIDPVRKALEDANLRKADVDEVVLVGGSTRIPRIQAMLKEYFNGKEPNKGINPDEAVAYGAAVWGAILAGVRDHTTSDLLLLDIAPLTLGLETTGGVIDKIIPRNTRIPTSKTKEYTTSENYQTSVMNRVFEGERTLAKDNRLLGEFVLSGFPKLLRGQVIIEVTFDINADGILKVSAREKISKVETAITVSNAVKLSEADIVRMTKDAEVYAVEDNKAKQFAMAIQKLQTEITDGLFWSTIDVEKKGNFTDQERDTIELEVKKSRDWVARHGVGTPVEEVDDEWRRFRAATDDVLGRFRETATRDGDKEPIPDIPPSELAEFVNVHMNEAHEDKEEL